MTAERGKDLDTLFKKSGGFGWFQIFLAFSLQWQTLYLCLTATAIFTLGIIEPKLTCYDPYFIPNVDHYRDHDKMCDIRSNCSAYNSTTEFHSFVEEFDLLCQSSYISNLIMTVQACTGLVGIFIMGHMIDHWGRRWIFSISCCISIFLILLASFATNWKMLMFCIAGVGMIDYSASCVYFSELVTKKYRSIIVVCSQWCLAYAGNALVAYLTGNWRSYLQTIACICIPLVIIYMFVLVESPRWLIQKGKLDDASHSLERISKMNRISDQMKEELRQEDLSDYIHANKEEKYPYNFTHLFSTRTVAIRTLLQCAHYFLNSMATLVILLSMQSLAGSTILNLALHGLLRLWVPFLVVWLDWRAPQLGRRFLLMGSLIIMTVCYSAISTILIIGADDHLQILVAILSQAAAIITVSSFMIAVQLYNVELFPTVLRNVANAVTGVSGGIGAILAPQALMLQSLWFPSAHVLVSCLCVIVFIADLFLLPETHGQPLVEAIADLGNGKRANYGTMPDIDRDMQELTPN